MSHDAPSDSVRISNIIQIWDGRKIGSVKIQKKIYGSINTDN